MVVPVEPEGDAGPSLRALRKAWPKGLRGEATLAQGRQPSRQRNVAVRQSRAKFIWFLDSDSQAQPGSLERLLKELWVKPAVGADGKQGVTGGCKVLTRERMSAG